MNSTAITRRIGNAIGGALIAAGVVLGSLAVVDPAIADAQPTGSGQCSSMAMTDGRSGPPSNALTRAGQVAAIAGPGASDGSMAVNCQADGHG